MRRAVAIGTALGLLACAGAGGPPPEGPVVPRTPVALASAAYVYAYPLVLFDLERNRQVQLLGAWNQLAARTTTATPFTTDLIAGSADTVSTTALLDLRSGPLVLSVPESGGRYVRIALLDAYTNVFASLGRDAAGGGATNYVITGPAATSAVVGATEVRAPTNHVWLHGQVAALGERDVPAASGLMRRWSLTPAAEFASGRRRLAVERPRAVDPEGSPVERVEAMEPAAYFREAARLLQINPPAPADKPLVDKFPSIGVDWKSGRFDPAKLPAATATQARADALQRIRGAQPARVERNGWTLAPAGGSWGVDYVARAAAARAGIGGALAEDEIVATARVDASGQRLQGAHRYVLHFPKGAEPPVRAFWSLTLLDDRGRMVDNVINRYAVRSERLRRDGDGGTTVHVQFAPPGGDRGTNWLPAPAHPFQLVLRLYAPGEAAISGAWSPPAVRRVD